MKKTRLADGGEQFPVNIGNCRSQKYLSTTKAVFLGKKNSKTDRVFVSDNQGNCVVIEVSPGAYREYAVNRGMIVGMFLKVDVALLEELSSNLKLTPAGHIFFL